MANKKESRKELKMLTKRFSNLLDELQGSQKALGEERQKITILKKEVDVLSRENRMFKTKIMELREKTAILNSCFLMFDKGSSWE